MSDLRAHLLTLAADRGSLTKLARDLGVSLSHLSRVAKGARPGPKLLAALGWERVVTYRPIGAEPCPVCAARV